MERDSLLATVGTSLFTNLRSDRQTQLPENWDDIQKNFHSRNWNQLAAALGKLDPTTRLCGAEINTIHEICSKKLRLRNLIFLVSDTEDGRATGQTLQKYFESRSEL